MERWQKRKGWTDSAEYLVGGEAYHHSPRLCGSSIPVQSLRVHLGPRRVPGFDSSPSASVHVAVSLWRVGRRQLAANPEAVAVFHEHLIFVCGAVVRPFMREGRPCRRPNTEPRRGWQARFLRQVPCGRCRREALFANITTHREPPSDFCNGSA